MRVAIAGAGAVGRSIARELIENGHQVLLIDKNPSSIRPERVPNAEWLLADSCELSSLAEAQLGDDATPTPELLTRVLRGMVDYCSTELNLGLFPEEVTAVAAVLDRDHYRFMASTSATRAPSKP